MWKVRKYNIWRFVLIYQNPKTTGHKKHTSNRPFYCHCQVGYSISSKRRGIFADQHPTPSPQLVCSNFPLSFVSLVAQFFEIRGIWKFSISQVRWVAGRIFDLRYHIFPSRPHEWPKGHREPRKGYVNASISIELSVSRIAWLQSPCDNAELVQSIFHLSPTLFPLPRCFLSPQLFILHWVNKLCFCGTPRWQANNNNNNIKNNNFICVLRRR